MTWKNVFVQAARLKGFSLVTFPSQAGIQPPHRGRIVAVSGGDRADPWLTAYLSMFSGEAEPSQESSWCIVLNPSIRLSLKALESTTGDAIGSIIILIVQITLFD